MWLTIFHKLQNRNITLHHLLLFSEYFENFKVLVQNRSSKQETQECYNHAGIAPKSKQFIVLCNSRLVGDQVTIKLTKKHTQLVICDVKINGGKSLDFNLIIVRHLINHGRVLWTGILKRGWFKPDGYPSQCKYIIAFKNIENYWIYM
jgi:hypothetical protein